MSQDLADFSMNYALKRGASYAEARFEDSAGYGFSMENGVLTNSAFDEDKGINVRVMVGGGQAFSSTLRLEKGHLKRMIDLAVRAAKRSSSNMRQPIGMTEEKMHRKKYQIKQKKKLLDISQEQRMELLSDLNKRVAAVKGVTSVVLSLSDGVTKGYYVNSDGARIESVIPETYSFYMYSLAHKARKMQKYYMYMDKGGWEVIEKWNLNKTVVDEVNRQLNVLKKGVKAPKGKMDLLCGSEVVGIMAHESVGHPFEADRILGRESAQAGESFVSPKMLGTRLGSNEVNITDTPLIPNSPGYYEYDDEGVKAKDKVLVKDGIINDFLHNRETAAEFGTKSNSGARADGYNREPIIRMSNTFLKPGKYSEQELIEQVKKGIYMHNFMEWNIDDKRLNQKYVGSEAYLIKNGKVVGPVLNPIIEISTPDLWSALVARGNKKTMGFHAGPCGKGEPMQTAPVYMGGPAALFKEIRVK